MLAFRWGKNVVFFFPLLCLYLKCPLSLWLTSFWCLLQEQINIHLFAKNFQSSTKMSNLILSLNRVFQLSAYFPFSYSLTFAQGVQEGAAYVVQQLSLQKLVKKQHGDAITNAIC